MSPDGPTRVFLIDPQVLFRMGVRRALEETGAAVVVGEAEHPRQVKELRAGVTVLGLAGGRTEDISRLLALNPAGRILVMGQRSHAIQEALAAGASAWLSRNARPDELLAALRETASGGLYVQASLAGRLIGGRSAPCPLKPRERAILEQLAQGNSLRQAASALHLSHQTVKTYLSRAYHRLGVQDRAQALVVGLRNGWLEVPDKGR